MKTKRFKKVKGFTLVELIVVIGIVSVLAVVGGLTLTQYVGESRNTRIKSDIATITKALEINYVKSSEYPMPDEVVTMTGESGDVLWYQGKLGKGVVEKVDELGKVPEDIYAEDKRYVYSITSDKDKYQIGSITMGNVSYRPYIEKVYANNFVSIIEGNYKDRVIVKGDGESKRVYPVPSIIIENADIERTKLSGDINFVVNGGENFVSDYKKVTGRSKGGNRIKWRVGSGEQIAGAITGAYENFEEDGYEEIATMSEEEVVEEVERTEGTLTAKASCENIAHGNTKVFYSTGQVEYGNSCENYKSTFECNDGEWENESKTKEDYSEEKCVEGDANNCLADRNYTNDVLTGTYNIEATLHNNEWSGKTTVSENNGTYEYELSTTCNNGTYIGNSEAGPTLVSCDSGYEISGNNCIAKTTIVNGAIHNGRNYTFTGFTLEYNKPQTKISQALDITNGTIRLTAKFTLGTDGTTVNLSEESENISCDTNYSWNGSVCEYDYNTSCKTILESGGSDGDGVYKIDPDGKGGVSPFEVYCDMNTDGGGWTLVNKTYLDNTNPGRIVDILDQSWIDSDMNIDSILNISISTDGTKPVAGHKLSKFNDLINNKDYTLRYEFISSDGTELRKGFVFSSDPNVFLNWQVGTPSFVFCSDLNKTNCNNLSKWINGGNSGDSTDLSGSEVLDPNFTDSIHYRYNGTYQSICSNTFDATWWPDNGADGHWGNGQRTWLR